MIDFEIGRHLLNTNSEKGASSYQKSKVASVSIDCRTRWRRWALQTCWFNRGETHLQHKQFHIGLGGLKFMQQRRIFAFSFALLVTFAPLRRVKNDASVKPRVRARAQCKQKRDRATTKHVWPCQNTLRVKMVKHWEWPRKTDESKTKAVVWKCWAKELSQHQSLAMNQLNFKCSYNIQKRNISYGPFTVQRHPPPKLNELVWEIWLWDELNLTFSKVQK